MTNNPYIPPVTDETNKAGRPVGPILDFMQHYGGLLIVTAMLTIFSSVYVLSGIAASGLAEAIAAYTLPIAFVTWVQADARIHRRTPCFDFGMFVFLTWIFSVPWYLIYTRGWRGLLLALLFLVLLGIPSLGATLAWMVVAITS